jgi:hypothetical protein
MKYLIALVILASGFLSPLAEACLNDTSILADGSYEYSGVSQSGHSVVDSYFTLTIETDSVTRKRFLRVNGSSNKYEITGCSPPVHPGFANTYFVRSEVNDTTIDTYKIFDATIEARGGYPVYSSNSSTLLWSREYVRYSKEGMRLENETSWSFRPGFYVGHPHYDSSGRLELRYDGSSSPRKLK